MPRYKGSCGCYNREDARKYGLAVAVVWNDILDRAEHFDINPMWYDQQQASDRLGIPRQTVNRAVKVLQVEGRLKAKVGYRPNSRVTTTWIEVLEDETDMNGEWISEVAKESKELGDILDAQNEHPKDAQNEHPILKETKEKRLTQDVVVRVEKWDFDSKGTWKRKRTVYTTVDEADKIEEAEKDEYVSFGFWPSPPLVGHQDKMKTMSEKKTKLKTEYPDVEEKTEKKTGGYMEGIGW